MSEVAEVSGDGRSRRWEQHRAQRRAELTHAARRAIHHGGSDLSMDEIAGAIGTSKSIVYRYFTDRTGLQTAIGEAVLVDLGDASPARPVVPGNRTTSSRAWCASTWR